MPPQVPAAAEPPPSDLGFGGVVTRRRGYRLINRDGSFNVRVRKGNWWRTFFSYHTLLTMPWWRFFALVFAGYLAINALFAVGYHGLGDAIENATEGSFADAFFFSVQTLATIGYGKMAPRTIAGNLLVTAEALLGMVGLAVTTGLVFARFSRTTGEVIFSKKVCISPFDGVPTIGSDAVSLGNTWTFPDSLESRPSTAKNSPKNTIARERLEDPRVSMSAEAATPPPT